MPFADGTFDLITSLSVLHHIANVSTVFGEMVRCLKPGGYLIVRDPIVSMGDWSRNRPGLTKRERGIPLHHFRRMIAENGLQVVREAKCYFSLSRQLGRVGSGLPFNRSWSVVLDALLCCLPWRMTYHAVHPWQKLRPTSVFYVLRKP
jgi:SAM-dependent methyltransferase